MSLRSDTLFWFWANQSSLFLLNAVLGGEAANKYDWLKVNHMAWVKVRGGCWSFCLYWWNWWPSLFKLSFHNVCTSYNNDLMRWRMNMLVTSQYQPRLSSITNFFSRRISQSDCSIHIKLNYICCSEDNVGIV
jgi:hypothetical protein